MVAAAPSDLETILEPAPNGASAGTDLQYSPAFAELERAAAGKSERSAGSAVIPAEPPDWRAVGVSARGLLGQSKDLRVALYLARALLETNGFAGLREGLRLVHGIVEKYWDSFHPQLEREGTRDDATKRINALRALTYRDMVLAVRAAPLVVSKLLGPVTLKAIDAAAAAARPAPAPPAGKPALEPEKGVPTTAALEGAMQSVPLEAMSEALVNVAGCVTEIRAIAEFWEQKLPGQGPDFSEVRRALSYGEQKLRTHVNGRQLTAPPAVAAEAMPGATGAAPAPTAGAAFSAEIRSREDVVRAIDAICAYYTRFEPSSPLPLLLLRSKRMVTMSFTDIMKELLPDAIANLQKITGKTDA